MARSIYGNLIGRAARISEPLLAPDNKEYKSHLCPFCAGHVIPLCDKAQPYTGHCPDCGTVTYVSMYYAEAELFRQGIKAHERISDSF